MYRRWYHGQAVLYAGYPRMFVSNPIAYIRNLLFIPILGLGLVLLIRWWWKNFSTRLLLTKTLIVYTAGVLNSKTQEIRISDVRDIEIEQTVWQKVLRAGEIRISTAGKDGFEIELLYMPRPNTIRRVLDKGRVGPDASSD